MNHLKHLSTGTYTLIEVLMVWSMILVVFVGFWLLNRYLKKSPKNKSYSRRLADRLQTRKRRREGSEQSGLGNLDIHAAH